MPVTLNTEQKLYVIPEGDGYSCYGFQNCFDDVAHLADLLAVVPPAPEDFGTLELYERRKTLLKKYADSPHATSTWFNPRTLPAVRMVLSELITNRREVRIFLGDTVTGRSWMEEHDVVGHIGRSTGWMKVPLLIAKGEDGGGAISTDCIIKIYDTKTGHTLYQHPLFHVPEMAIVPAVSKGYVEGVTVGDELHAQFEKPGQAARWIAFMKGERNKP